MSNGWAALASTVTAGAVSDPATMPIATPWGSSELQRIMWADVFGTDIPVASRTQAMRIPSIFRGRNLMVTSISRSPLRHLDAAGSEVAEPAPWIASTAHTSPIFRLAWTVDDLIFYGWSCWARGTDPLTGDETMTRVNQDEWDLDPDNKVRIHGNPVQPGSVILIPGLHEGILNAGKEALADTAALYSAVRQRLVNPIPGIDLHQTGGKDLTNDEIDLLIARWSAARQGKNGGVAYTNQYVEAKPMDGGDAQLMIDARNAAAVEMARLVGVHAGMVDATAPKASLNYETSTGRNQEFTDLDLALYMLPIAARLSMDDVVGPGERVEFDLTDWTAPAPSPTGPARED